MPEEDNTKLAEELETEEVEETAETETETDNNTTEEEPVFSDTEEQEEKKYTQAEMDEVVERRLARERRKLEKEYRNKNKKYDELAYLTGQGIGGENLDDTLEKTREFYNEKGIKYTPKVDERDTEVLASADAEEIIESCNSTEELEKEIRKLKAEDNLTERESIVLTKLQDNVARQKQIASLETIGASKEVYESDKFKKFANDFNKDKPIEDIYDMYMQLNNSAKKTSAGSMKSEPDTKGVKEFYTYEEASKLTIDDYNKNPGLLEAVERSQAKW